MHDRGRTAPVTHYDVHGLVTLRLDDAPQHVVDDVTRELGAPRAVPGREPDLVVRFVDRVPPSGYLRLLGLHDAAFDDEHFSLLDPQRRRARVDLTRPTRSATRTRSGCTSSMTLPTPTADRAQDG